MFKLPFNDLVLSNIQRNLCCLLRVELVSLKVILQYYRERCSPRTDIIHTYRDDNSATGAEHRESTTTIEGERKGERESREKGRERENREKMKNDIYIYKEREIERVGERRERERE